MVASGITGGVWCVGSLASVLCLWAFWSTAQISPCPGVSDQSKFSCLKVKGPNYQQSNRGQKKIFNKIKTGEEEKFLSRCKTVNHPEHLVLLWNIFKWFERVFLPDFTVNYKNWGTCVDLPNSRLASWRWKEHGLLRYSTIWGFNLHHPEQAKAEECIYSLHWVRTLQLHQGGRLVFVCQMSISKI